jgi:hypothetical protein
LIFSQLILAQVLQLLSGDAQSTTENRKLQSFFEMLY